MATRVHLWIAAAVTVLTAAACGTVAGAAPPPFSAPPPSLTPTPSPARITYSERGHGKWSVAPAQSGEPAGDAGHLMRYRVAVEKDIRGLTPAAFAQTVATTLADPRGWTAGGRWRFRRVGPGEHYDFTVYLATPRTRDRLCDDNADGYTSCRNGASVVLNAARWVKGVPQYAGAGLAMYRTYMVNHEVGHRLGNGHQLCPAPGRPAPVMEQQTLGLHGCRPNPWPYPNGRLYTGRPGQYGDHPPARDRGNL